MKLKNIIGNRKYKFIIGLGRKEVKLIKHNPEWRWIFDRESKKIQKVFGENLLDIQHFGSTAISGMKAKPIIDMIAGVSDFKKIKKFLKPLEKLGYEYRPDAGTNDRLFFRKGGKFKSSYHLHLVKMNSRDWKDNLFFRDYLRENKQTAKEYASLKKELAKKFSNDRESYLSGKTEFIKKMINKGKK